MDRIEQFRLIVNNTLQSYVKASEEIGDVVAQQCKYVRNAFEAQLVFLSNVTNLKSITNDQMVQLLTTTKDLIDQTTKIRDENRQSKFFNHLSTISESIVALAWVQIKSTPAPYVKEMSDAGQFYGNRVLKDFKEKDAVHCQWIKSWFSTLNALQAYVKNYHTTGLMVGGGCGQGVLPPPPPPPPPADFINNGTAMMDDGTNTDHSALFAEINQGENITKSLKRVTPDMQTHKNPQLRQGPAPYKTPNQSEQNADAANVNKPAVFKKDGKKWLIEYQKGNRNIVVDDVEMNNVVYLFHCVDSTVTVKGKINSITLDSCKKTAVIFDNLVSSIEFINCASVQMQVLGKVPTISIDKTDGCQMYLSSESLDVEIVTSKSSEMNVLIPKADGDFMECPIPEQLKTTVNPGKGIQTAIVENNLG